MCLSASFYLHSECLFVYTLVTLRRNVRVQGEKKKSPAGCHKATFVKRFFLFFLLFPQAERIPLSSERSSVVQILQGLYKQGKIAGADT